MGPRSVGGLRATSGRSPDRTPLVAGRFNGDHILVPLLTSDVATLTDQLTVATTLARTTNGTLTVVNPKTGPEQPPATYHHEGTDSDAAALHSWVFDQTDDPHPVDGEVLTSRTVVWGVLQAVRQRAVDTLILPKASGASRLRRSVTEQIAAHADADVVVVNGQAGFRKVASILLPVAGGPHSGVAADIATAIARDFDAWIDILHIIDEEPSTHQCDRAETLVTEISQRIAHPETTSTWVYEASNPAAAIIEQSRYYGLTVVGAPTRSRLRQFIFGSTTSSVRSGADSVVLSVRNNSYVPRAV